MAKQKKKKPQAKKAAPKKKPAKKKAAKLHTLDQLYRTIESRKGADPNSSYTARLMAKGPIKLAQKLGEEAIEAAIEGVRGDRKKLVAESADVLYHLLALWASRNVKPQQIWAELVRREGVSGLVEKASRGKAMGRKKKI
jgi:phosphoribosyl-ATP pyrophosphohydrolase